MPETLPLAFLSMPGGMEWVIIGLVALLIFGNRLPGVARSLGQALREFKSGLSGTEEEIKKNVAPDAVAKTDASVAPDDKKPDSET